MNFLWWMGNHNAQGQRSLEDPISIISHQLAYLGHDAKWDPKNQKFITRDVGYNLLVEGFTPFMVNIMAEHYAQGARFIILATEEPTAKGFNHGTQKEMVKRQDMFPEAAKYADGIIHLVPGENITRWYSQFCPAAYTELGYAPTLVRQNDFSPTYEFGFFGSVTPRRLKILNRLSKWGRVRIVGDFSTIGIRDRQMREAKVIVQLRKFDAMGLVSSSRCNTSLCLGRPIIAEPHDLSKPWDEIVKFTSSMDDFYNTCMVYKNVWRGIWNTQFDKFKDRLSPDACIGKAMRDIGLFDGENRAKAA